MIRFAFGLLVVASAAILAKPILASDNNLNSIDPSELTLTFDEPFDSLDVSAWGPGTRWIAHTPWAGDFGAARFTNPKPDFPFTIKNGELRIEASRDSEGKWRSGLLASVDPKGNGFSQKYGYFEIRARLPNGEGVWPAFWLIGLDYSKYTAEIDVFEFYGYNPVGYSSNVHVWRPGGKRYTKHKRVDAFVEADPTDYHTYGVWVDAENVRMYFDRELVWETPTPEEHRQPHFILLNLALLNLEKYHTPDPSYMFVDYVRVYSAK